MSNINIIEIEINIDRVYDYYTQGTTSIQNALANIKYEVHWESNPKATTTPLGKITIPSGQSFTWKVHDINGDSDSLTLLSPIAQWVFKSEKNDTDKKNEYTCTMAKHSGTIQCTLAVMYCVPNSNDRFLFAWDPEVESEGGPP